jgi:hypothetical protein
MAFTPYKDETRKNYGCTDRLPDTNELKLGALMRIADATEAMAKNYTALIAERDRLKQWYESEQRLRQRLERSNAALRGQITKLRKRLVEE